MLGAIWSGLGGRVADKWADALLSPATAFWTGGLVTWVYANGGIVGPKNGWQQLPGVWNSVGVGNQSVVQVAVVVFLLFLVTSTAQLVNSLTLFTLRLLEGYWPGWASPLRTAMVAMRRRRIDRDAARWRELYQRKDRLRPSESVEFIRLNWRRANVPADPSDRMPTALGDLLKAIETRPRHRYGLDAVICFPRLWMLLPDAARSDLAGARTALDPPARLFVWSLLFAIWTPLAWWAVLVAVAGIAVGYRMEIAAGREYGQLLQSAFDLYRSKLYEAVGWVLPDDPAQERRAGAELTTLFERGPAENSHHEIRGDFRSSASS